MSPLDLQTCYLATQLEMGQRFMRCNVVPRLLWISGFVWRLTLWAFFFCGKPWWVLVGCWSFAFECGHTYLRLPTRTAQTWQKQHPPQSSWKNLKDLEHVMDEQFMIHAYSCDFMRYEHLDFFVIHCCSHCYPERWRTFSGARQAKRSVAIARWNDWGENRGIQLATALTPVKHGLHVATPHMKISSKSVRFEGSSTLLQALPNPTGAQWNPMNSFLVPCCIFGF